VRRLQITVTPYNVSVIIDLLKVKMKCGKLCCRFYFLTFFLKHLFMSRSTIAINMRRTTIPIRRPIIIHSKLTPASSAAEVVAVPLAIVNAEESLVEAVIGVVVSATDIRACVAALSVTIGFFSVVATSAFVASFEVGSCLVVASSVVVNNSVDDCTAVSSVISSVIGCVGFLILVAVVNSSVVGGSIVLSVVVAIVSLADRVSVDTSVVIVVTSVVGSFVESAADVVSSVLGGSSVSSLITVVPSAVDVSIVAYVVEIASSVVGTSTVVSAKVVVSSVINGSVVKIDVCVVSSVVGASVVLSVNDVVFSVDCGSVTVKVTVGVVGIKVESILVVAGVVVVGGH